MSNILVTRQRRKLRVRRKVKAQGHPRLAVFRSNKHIYAQIVDDEKGQTLVAASTQTPTLKVNLTKCKSVDASKQVGLLLGKLALEKNIQKVVFDRGAYKYHGRVKAIADGAREAGLQF